MSKFNKIARHNGPPIEHQSWWESINVFDAHLESIATLASMQVDCSKEEVIDLWLETPNAFMEGLTDPSGSLRMASGVRRMQSGGMGLQRSNQSKTASMEWDQDFADAKKHAMAVMERLGK
jgi:hypothetical protein